MSLGFLQQAAHVLGTSPRDRRSGDQRIYRIADGLFLYRGFFSNSCVLILPRSVVVVDSQVSPLGGQRLRAAIAQVTSLPVKHVINTHYHGDHTGGNAAFPEAEIIASECTARLMTERDGEREEYARTFGLAFQHLHPTIAPTRTFQGAMRLSIDGEVLELMQIGKVETPDASVVHWPARRAVACGDGVATRDYPFLGVPFLDEGLRGDGSWLAFLAKIRSWEPEYLLPGHGPALTSRKEIADRLDLLTGLFQDLLTCVEEEL